MYYHAYSLFIITDYDVHFIVRNYYYYYYYYYYSLLSYSLGHVLQQFSLVVHYAIMRCHIAHPFCVMDLVLTSPITLAS